MRGKLVALAATLTMAYTPGARAQTPTGPPTLSATQDLPQTVDLPATFRGRGGTTEGTLHFTINDFQRGKHGSLCAVGVVNGDGIQADTPVTVPVAANGGRPNAGDCEGGGDDDEHGSLIRPGLGARPASGLALGLVQPAPFQGEIGGAIVPARICPILDLTIGRIRLDLLGLIVDTHAPIHITITGNTTGGLLGSLLCALLSPP